MDDSPLLLKQVAEMANVSASTVSRVLNNTGRISEDTRKRVMALIEQIGYVPNNAAKALRTGSGRAVGLIIPSIGNMFFSQIIDAMGKFFFDNDYSLFVCNAEESLEKSQALLRNLRGKGVDGIIYISRFPFDPKSVSAPVVFLDRAMGVPDNCAYVCSDNIQGGRLAAQALVDAGTTRPVMLCDPEDLDGLTTIGDRIAGFAEVLHEHRIKWSRKDIIPTAMNVPAARNNVKKTFTKKNKYDGVFSTLDVGAIGALFGLEDAGLQVPRDVNVVGFDDISFSEFCKPSLTTVRQDSATLTNTAAQLLLSAMQGKTTPHGEILVPVELIVRDSTRK